LDGTDLEKCLHTLHEAVAQARGGGGPQLVVAELLRLCGHGEHDDAQYISAQFKQSRLGRDCLKVAEDHLLRRGWADAAIIRTFREEAALEVEQAVALVQREPGPDPYKENWCALASRHLSERFETPDSAASP
jgi:pyruvate dehydrogenase E1 component alpha subunit/2-oxoisovalerate dehydrogenase E1 component alpha subunit